MHIWDVSNCRKVCACPHNFLGWRKTRGNFFITQTENETLKFCVFEMVYVLRICFFVYIPYNVYLQEMKINYSFFLLFLSMFKSSSLQFKNCESYLKFKWSYSLIGFEKLEWNLCQNEKCWSYEVHILLRDTTIIK